MSNGSDPTTSPRGRHMATAAIFVAAVLLIVFGVYSGEAEEVFQKAVNICLECIGVG